MTRLLRRLKADLPPFRYMELYPVGGSVQYVIDCPDASPLG